VLVNSDQVQVVPQQFGPMLTRLHVSVRPLAEGMVWTTIRLVAANATQEIPVLAHWRAGDAEILPDTASEVAAFSNGRATNPSIPPAPATLEYDQALEAASSKLTWGPKDPGTKTHSETQAGPRMPSESKQILHALPPAPAKTYSFRQDTMRACSAILLALAFVFLFGFPQLWPLGILLILLSLLMLRLSQP
jgi:hypothetical protein